jgi:uncharacterized protein (TIGR01370 family)
MTRGGTTLLLIATGVAACAAANTGTQAPPMPRFLIYYSDRAPAADLADYDLVVLDADRHPPLAALRERGRVVLAYLSLTEIGRHRRPFTGLERSGALLGPHPHWTDAHYVDVRRPEWTKTVLDELIPTALSAGFNGLFLDTLDDVELFERDEPGRSRGMRQAAIDLVRAIRQRYPPLVLMVNRGYALMSDLAPSVDILLGESVVTSFDQATKAYRRVSPSDIQWQQDALRRAKTTNPALRLFTLDYWDPADTATVRDIYRRQRANGFVPYVATPLLDQIIREPR